MLKKPAIILSLFVFALFGVFFYYVLHCHTSITAYYPKLGMQMVGSRYGFEPVEYWWLSVTPAALSSASSSRPIFRNLALVVNNTSYPLNSLTTTTLGSLGFSVWSPDYGTTYRAMRGSGIVAVEFTFQKNNLGDFSFTDIGAISPFSFSYHNGSATKLPISQEQMEAMFGKPDRIKSDMLKDVSGEIMNTIRLALVKLFFP